MKEIKKDGISYPNKVTRQIFSYLPVNNLKFEYQDTWTNRKIYDVYFEYKNQKYLVEVDGQQHYQGSKYTTLEYQQQNDKYKDELAKQNNIPLIRIDCRNSNFNYIKNSYLKSKLNQIFDLTKLNWNQIRLDSLKNEVIEVCHYYNENPNKTTIDIAQDLKLNKTTVLNYLKEGAECGICSYTVEKAKQLGIEKRTLTRRKNGNTRQVDIYNKEGNFIYHFDSLNEAANELNKKYPEIGFTADGLRQAYLNQRLYKNTFKVIINNLEINFTDQQKEIFDYYNKNNYPSLEEICNKFNITVNQLRSLLIKGKQANLCNFDSQKSYEKTLEKRVLATKKSNGYHFNVYKDNCFFKDFYSINDFITYEKENNITPYMGKDKTRELIHDNSLTYKGWKIEVLNSPKRKDW